MNSNQTIALAAASLCALVGAAALAPGCGSGDGGAGASTSVAAGAAGAGGAGKSGAPGTAGVGGGATGGTSGAAGTAGSGGFGPCGPPPFNAPAGWQEVAPGEWSCATRMFRDPHPELTEPWDWSAPCPPDAPTGGTCEALVEPPIDGQTVHSTVAGGTDAGGGAALAWWRASAKSADVANGGFYHALSPLTGRPRLSIYTTLGKNALAMPAYARTGSLTDGRALFKLYGDGTADPAVSGTGYGARVQAVDTATTPTTPYTWVPVGQDAEPATISWSYAVSAEGLLTHRYGLTLRPFDRSPDVPIYTAANDPEGLPGFFAAVRGAEVIVKVSAAGRSGYYSWTPTAGLRPLLRAPFDLNQAWGALSSDGKDLVWAHAEGVPKAEYDYPKFTLYTAPWTADPAVLAATARSIGDNSFGARFAEDLRVGCGYAVQGNRQGVEKGSYSNVEIVRLATGERWILKNNSKLGALTLSAVTCEHVYLGVPPFANIRVRLDSLGPPSPPPAAPP